MPFLNLPSFGLKTVVSVVFSAYTVFILAYAGLVIFALVRFGRSRLVSIIASALFMAFLVSLYTQAQALLASL